MIKSNQIRSIWGYVRVAFNKVDAERLQQVGPDRLCCEWMLKNGGAVMIKGGGNLIKDYNSLPPQNIRFKIKEIDATGAAVMDIGFDHLQGCQYIDRIILDDCQQIEDGTLARLKYVKDTLKELQVTACNNIGEEGLKSLKELVNLNKLTVGKLSYVKDWPKVEAELKAALANCNVEVLK